MGCPVAVGMIVRSRKAYLPAIHFSEKHRLYFDQEPVLVVDLVFEELVKTVRKKMEEGNPPIEVPEDLKERERWLRKIRSILPRAAGFRSWRAFARKGRAYGISFLEDKITVDMSGPLKGSWFVYDPKKTREFPPDTPLEEVVRPIWEDICSILELWEEEP